MLGNWNSLPGAIHFISTAIGSHAPTVNIGSAPFLLQYSGSLETMVFSLWCFVAFLLASNFKLSIFLGQWWLMFQSTLLITSLQLWCWTRSRRGKSTERTWASGRVISLRFRQCSVLGGILGALHPRMLPRWLGWWTGFFGWKIWATGARARIKSISTFQTLLICLIEEWILIHRRVSRRIKPLRFRTAKVRAWIYSCLSHSRHVKIIRRLPRLVQIITNRQPKIEILRLILLIFITFHRLTTLLHTCDARRIQRNI